MGHPMLMLLQLFAQHVCSTFPSSLHAARHDLLGQVPACISAANIAGCCRMRQSSRRPMHQRPKTLLRRPDLWRECNKSIQLMKLMIVGELHESM